MQINHFTGKSIHEALFDRHKTNQTKIIGFMMVPVFNFFIDEHNLLG